MNPMHAHWAKLICNIHFFFAILGCLSALYDCNYASKDGRQRWCSAMMSKKKEKKEKLKCNYIKRK